MEISICKNLCNLRVYVIFFGQAGMMVGLAAGIDCLFESSKKMSIIGVRVDVDRDTSAVTPIDGDESKVKKFMFLTLLDGSCHEHLTLDIPMGTITTISGVKGVQIAASLGIPIHTITSENIDEILPILRVSSEVKANVQNAINAGMEAIVPEEEITYFGWCGCGYILYNPETGAGACLITGGAAGAETIFVIGIWVLAFKTFSENNALIIEGEPLPSPIEIIKNPFYLFQEAWFSYSIYLSIGSTYLAGWCPIFYRARYASFWLKEVAKSNYKILCHFGHGSEEGHLVLSWFPPESIQVYEIKSIETQHYEFVFINSCYGAAHARAFKATCSLGYDYAVKSHHAIYFERAFWVKILSFPPSYVITAKEFGEDFVRKKVVGGSKFKINLYGNGYITLRRLYIKAP
jgi:hypothetical protein